MNKRHDRRSASASLSLRSSARLKSLFFTSKRTHRNKNPTSTTEPNFIFPDESVKNAPSTSITLSPVNIEARPYPVEESLKRAGSNSSSPGEIPPDRKEIRDKKPPIMSLNIRKHLRSNPQSVNSSLRNSPKWCAATTKLLDETENIEGKIIFGAQIANDNDAGDPSKARTNKSNEKSDSVIKQENINDHSLSDREISFERNDEIPVNASCVGDSERSDKIKKSEKPKKEEAFIDVPRKIQSNTIFRKRVKPIDDAFDSYFSDEFHSEKRSWNSTKNPGGINFINPTDNSRQSLRGSKALRSSRIWSMLTGSSSTAPNTTKNFFNFSNKSGQSTANQSSSFNSGKMSFISKLFKQKAKQDEGSRELSQDEKHFTVFNSQPYHFDPNNIDFPHTEEKKISWTGDSFEPAKQDSKKNSFLLHSHDNHRLSNQDQVKSHSYSLETLGEENQSQSLLLETEDVEKILYRQSSVDSANTWLEVATLDKNIAEQMTKKSKPSVNSGKRSEISGSPTERDQDQKSLINTWGNSLGGYTWDRDDFMLLQSRKAIRAQIQNKLGVIYDEFDDLEVDQAQQIDTEVRLLSGSLRRMFFNKSFTNTSTSSSKMSSILQASAKSNKKENEK